MTLNHVIGQPPILYFGTPVVLISTVNEDGTDNLAPMSSAWWLGWRCMLGLSNGGKTAQNLRRTRECVLNLPSINEVGNVNSLARLTGVQQIPELKTLMGYTFEPNKFQTARLTPEPALTVKAKRAKECPVQMEAILCGSYDLMNDSDLLSEAFSAFEVRITKIHLSPDLLYHGDPDRIDPDRWRPLIMSFQKFYGLTTTEVHESKLSEIPEALYNILTQN